MKLGEIYQLFVQSGIENDPRDSKRIERILTEEKKKFDKLNQNEKDYFDSERLVNPFADTRILFGDKNTEVKRILVGIDMEVGEVLLADRLSERGQKIDLILSHHPEGIALAGLSDVMNIQSDILNLYGVPINVAEGTLADRISEVSRGIAPVNHQRSIDAARLLGLPFMSSHTVADNMVYTYVKDVMDLEQPETVGDVIDLLMKIPEYKEGKKLGAGPRLFVGKEENRAGKIAVTEMTGGTSGSKEIFEKMAQAGIGTIIGMHMGEDHRKEAEKNHLNVVIAGHMASDSLGMNLLLDKLEKQGAEIIPVSGLIRVNRNK